MEQGNMSREEVSRWRKVFGSEVCQECVTESALRRINKPEIGHDDYHSLPLLIERQGDDKRVLRYRSAGHYELIL